MRINNFIPIRYQQSSFIRYTIEAGILVLGFKLLAGALASCAFIGVAVGVGLIFASLVYSIARNPSQGDELIRYSNNPVFMRVENT